MKNSSKAIVVLAACATIATASVTAYADEMPPGSPFAQFGTVLTSPQTSAAPVPAAPTALPIFSVEEYQDMHDNLAIPVEREVAGPALGARYGSGVVIGAMLEGEAVDDEAVPAAAAVVPTATNPVTGAADSATMLITGAALLSAAPLLLRLGKSKKKK